MLQLKSITYALAATAILLLSGCDTLNSLRMMQINSDVKPQWHGQEKIRLKSVFLGEKPYIYARVDGEELLFLLDTGARFLILMDTQKVRSLSLKRGFDLSLGGWGEEARSQAFQTEISQINLGGVQFDNMKAAMIPVSQSRYYKRADEAINDGVIGHDIMRHFTWEFDAANNAIYISQTPYQAHDHATRLEMSEFLSKITVEGDLVFNDEHMTTGEFIIDTGSRHYVKLSSAYTDNNEIAIASTRVRAADFGLSGKVEHDRVVLPSLTLGDIKLDNVKVNLIPGDDEDDWWVLGNALLNQFKTVIDYQSEAFYLLPQQDFVTDFNLFGLELRKIRSGEFVVRYVFPDLPASHLNLQVGDLVTKIDNVDASAISLSEYNDIASTAGLHQLCIKRQNQCFDLQANHIRGYSDRE